MVEFSIRCHPSVPLEATDLEEWLDARVRELRTAWPTGTIRLFRLSQSLPSDDVDVGWLLEAGLPADGLDIEQWLEDTLRDMHLLGFQPVTYVTDPRASPARAAGR
jgi:hypothetical protein